MYPLILIDYTGREIRLTQERHEHMLEHAEMAEQLDKIHQTIAEPDIVIATPIDEAVHVYHRHYATTVVGSKYLLVVVKIVDDDAFVLTAFFSSRQKKGTLIWQA